MYAYDMCFCGNGVIFKFLTVLKILVWFSEGHIAVIAAVMVNMDLVAGWSEENRCCAAGQLVYVWCMSSTSSS